MICPYEEIAPIRAEHVMVSNTMPGLKWTGLKTLLAQWQDWRNYRYVLLPDDDLFATQEVWSRFFECCTRYGARLAQPALTQSSYFTHLHTVHCTEFVGRRVGCVEVMTPCFATDVLAELLKTLELSETGSGWGLDYVWAKRLRYQQLFVMDETAVLHTRPVASAYAERLKPYWAEMLKIMREHQAPGVFKSFSGYRSDGSEITEGDRTFLYHLFHGYERMFAEKPERFRDMLMLQFKPFDPTNRSGAHDI